MIRFFMHINFMRTTITLDDEMLSAATKWTGIQAKSELINFVLQQFIQREAARRLAEMGGTMPDLELTPRGSRYGSEPLEEATGTRVAEDEN